MSAETKTSVTTQVYEIYIKAEPQAIWDAITTPEWTAKYGYRGPVEYDLRKGGAFRAHATPVMVSMGLPERRTKNEERRTDLNSERKNQGTSERGIKERSLPSSFTGSLEAARVQLNEERRTKNKEQRTDLNSERKNQGTSERRIK